MSGTQSGRPLLQQPFVAWAGPFIVFIALLALMPMLSLPPRLSLGLWLVVCAAAIWVCSRRVLEFRPSQWIGSIAVGVAVCAIWVAPDLLIPGWRSHWLFQNSITGRVATSMSSAALADPLALGLRAARAILIVPILEELFWRGWLMRWLVKPDFESVGLGTYSHQGFWIVALLFAAEHGPYWEVGFAAGAVYNWWLVRTRRLSDVILAHAVTNAALCAYVLASGRWEYWL